MQIQIAAADVDDEGDRRLERGDVGEVLLGPDPDTLKQLINEFAAKVASGRIAMRIATSVSVSTTKRRLMALLRASSDRRPGRDQACSTPGWVVLTNLVNNASSVRASV
jgi:hypothetical protein